MDQNNAVLTIAVSKGYLLSETLKILKKSGYEFDEEQIDSSRKLFAYDKSKNIRLLFIRPWDVSLYVEQGAADLGIVGKDVLIEKKDNVLELLDLDFGKCSLVLAGARAKMPLKLTHDIRIATKYPNSAAEYFMKLGIETQIFKMYGAIELAPLTGLSDIICDLTATGATLKENNLEIIETIFTSTARLVANPISMRFRYQPICDLTEKIKAIV
ncbi:ATP phosphoribosyltransferase [Candidatus Margulisiibacteriota bacterium]